MSLEGDLLLALPSKGQLEEPSREFLQSCGFSVRRGGSARAYTATLGGIDGVGIIFFRPDEIAARIEAGDVGAGITGEDLYSEYGQGPPASRILIRDLGYGGARLVVAVPRVWLDVTSLDDLDEVTVQYRRRHGRSLRVATKFAKLTRAFFSAHGIADYQIVNSAGATEGAPASGMAELIVDLTSSGNTLAQNHLKEIDGGTVLESQANLIVSARRDVWTERRAGALTRLVESIEARLRAKRNVMLRFGAPTAMADEACKKLVETLGCAIPARLGDLAAQAAPKPRMVERLAVCPAAKIPDAVALLRTFACDQVFVQRPEFIFAERSEYMSEFERAVMSPGSAQ